MYDVSLIIYKISRKESFFIEIFLVGKENISNEDYRIRSLTTYKTMKFYVEC